MLMHEAGVPLAFLDLRTAASKGGSWLRESRCAAAGYAVRGGGDSACVLLYGHEAEQMRP
jgi:hypothetical protein